MLGQNFPMSNYYRDHIIDAQTISRAGNWWTALLVISDPRTGRPFIGLYRGQKTDGEWKTRNRFFIRKKSDLNSVVECLGKFDGLLQKE